MGQLWSKPSTSTSTSTSTSFESWVDELIETNRYIIAGDERKTVVVRTVVVNSLLKIENKKLLNGDHSFELNVTRDEQIPHLKRKIEERTGIKSSNQTLLICNEISSIQYLNYEVDEVLVYDNSKYVCVRAQNWVDKDILLLQANKTDTVSVLKTNLAEIGLLDVDGITITEEDPYQRVEESDLLESLQCGYESNAMEMLEVRCGPSGLECSKGFQVYVMTVTGNFSFYTHPLQTIERLKYRIFMKSINRIQHTKGFPIDQHLDHYLFWQRKSLEDGRLVKDCKINKEDMICLRGRARGGGYYNAIVLDYFGEVFDNELKEKITKAMQIIKVASECHHDVRKTLEKTDRDINGIIATEKSELDEKYLDCFRMIVAELTGNDDQFIELVQQKAWEDKYDLYRSDWTTFKSLISSLALDGDNVQLVLRVKGKYSMQYKLWASADINNYRNSLPNIIMARSEYERHLHIDFLKNIKKIDGIAMIHDCQMGNVVPGDAIYLYHRRAALGDYAHVILYTGLKKHGTDQADSASMVKAKKQMMHCVHLKTIGRTQMILNFGFENTTTVRCEPLSKVIHDNDSCFVVRGSEDGERRREFLRRAFCLAEPPFTFDYDAKGGNCESVISAIWGFWDNLSPQGGKISDPDGQRRQKLLSWILRSVNTLAPVSLKLQLQNRLARELP